MQNEENDIAVGTKNFALEIIRLFPNSQEQQKRRSWGNNCYARRPLWEQIIAKHIADAVKRNGASGASDIDGSAARVAASEMGLSESK